MVQHVNMDRAATDLTRALTSLGVPGQVRTADGSILLSLKGGSSVRLVAVSAGGGWPSEVRAVLAGDARRPNWLIVAPQFSPGSVRLLNDAGVNWVDSRGNVRIVAPPVVLVSSRGMRDAPRTESSVVTSEAPTRLHWGGAAMDLAEELLSSSPGEISVTALSMATGWSPGMVSRVLQSFEQVGWLTASGGGAKKRRRLSEAGPMLDAWAEMLTQKPSRAVQAHALMRDPWRFLADQLLPLMPNVSYGATTWIAAEAIAPFASATPVIDLYVPAEWLDSEWPRLASASGSHLFARSVEDGANLRLRAADKHVLKRTRDAGSIRTVSAPRVYADLLALGGRAQDVAQHLREVALGF